MTKTEFRNRAVAAAKRANPEAVAAGMTIEWVRGPVAVTWADKTPGFSGTIQVAADGFRTRHMIATECGGALTVR